MTQKKAILKHLQEGKGISPLFALERFGCFRLADVIFRLKADGYNIKTEMVEHGKKRFARYVMIEEEMVTICMACGEIVERFSCEHCRGYLGTKEITLKEYEDGN